MTPAGRWAWGWWERLAGGQTAANVLCCALGWPPALARTLTPGHRCAHTCVGVHVAGRGVGTCRQAGQQPHPHPSLTPGIFRSSRCAVLEIPSQARISRRLQPILIPAVEFLRRPCQECLFFHLFRAPERQREEEASWHIHARDCLLDMCTLEAKACCFFLWARSPPREQGSGVEVGVPVPPIHFLPHRILPTCPLPKSSVP